MTACSNAGGWRRAWPSRTVDETIIKGSLLGMQADGVRADIAAFEQRQGKQPQQLQQDQQAGFPGRATGGSAAPPPADESPQFPGTPTPGTPLPGPPETAGLRGNPPAVFYAPAVAPAPTPASDTGAAAPFPGAGAASPPGEPFLADLMIPALVDIRVRLDVMV